ncbi:unnamed protein product, partial [Symbiodinium sp. CCMP2456]
TCHPRHVPLHAIPVLLPDELRIEDGRCGTRCLGVTYHLPEASAAKGNLAATTVDSLLVVSWNSAGFSRTHDLIKTHFGSLDLFLERHQADIFCVQETRITASHLKTREQCQQLGAVSTTGAYQSFWSFNEQEGGASRYNGVATWIRKDLAPQARATQQVLRDEIDKEGRCLLVDLGGLAVFNVYVPTLHCSEDGRVDESRLQQKVKFLHLLQMRIEETRKLGKQVLVCGDLNLTYRTADVAPVRLCLKIDEGRVCGKKEWALPEDATPGPHIPVGAAQKALRAQVTMTAESAKNCLRALVHGPEGFRVPNPPPPDLPLLPGRVLMAMTRIKGSETKVERSSLPKLWCRSRALSADAPLPWQSLEGLGDELVLLEFGVLSEELEAEGSLPHRVREAPCVDWLSALVSESSEGSETEGKAFVDTFAFCHGAACLGRYTQWNQTANSRFSNIGARLDYILCDTSMQKHLVRTPTSELAGSSPLHAAETAEAAQNAATCFGAWHSAPACGRLRASKTDDDGLGLQKDDMRLNNSQFRSPHTGILYTPPRYSDHVAVCAHFEGLCLGGVVALSEAESRRTHGVARAAACTAAAPATALCAASFPLPVAQGAQSSAIGGLRESPLGRMPRPGPPDLRLSPYSERSPRFIADGFYEGPLWAPQRGDAWELRMLRTALQAMVRQAACDAEAEDAKAMLGPGAGACGLPAFFRCLDPLDKGHVLDTDLLELVKEHEAPVSYASLCSLVHEANLRRGGRPLGYLTFRDLGKLIYPLQSKEHTAMCGSATDDEAKSILYLLQFSEPCPRCGFRIQRDSESSACPNVVCSKCGAAFRCFVVARPFLDAPKATAADRYTLCRLVAAVSRT